MQEKPTLYFKNDAEWRDWLHENHKKHTAIYLIFHKVSSETESMRWEEAVKVAICYGWIDSTVKKLMTNVDNKFLHLEKIKAFGVKSIKTISKNLIADNLMHESGFKKIEIAKQNGSWEYLDAVENLEIPEDLQIAFDTNEVAFANYKNFSKTYRKSYLYWLNQAKREETRQNRIAQIIDLCEKNIKSRE